MTRSIAPRGLAAAAAILIGTLLAAGAARAQAPRPGYDEAYIGAPLADPVVQHSKETYVRFGCAYCHGVELVPRGEAPDLRRSRLVGMDIDGDRIVPLLRRGIPQTAKLSPMPQYNDLSQRQLEDIARWIHFARRADRLRTLSAEPVGNGDAAAGRTFVQQTCRECHVADADLRALSAHRDAVSLRAEVLAPARLQADPSWTIERLQDAAASRGRARHAALLENYTAAEVNDVLAYLRGLP